MLQVQHTWLFTGDSMTLTTEREYIYMLPMLYALTHTCSVQKTLHGHTVECLYMSRTTYPHDQGLKETHLFIKDTFTSLMITLT